MTNSIKPTDVNNPNSFVPIKKNGASNPRINNLSQKIEIQQNRKSSLTDRNLTVNEQGINVEKFLKPEAVKLPSEETFGNLAKLAMGELSIRNRLTPSTKPEMTQAQACKLAVELSDKNIKEMREKTRELTEKDRKSHNFIKSIIKQFLAQATFAGLGAALGTFLIPIPIVGTIIGIAVGGFVGWLCGLFIAEPSLKKYESKVLPQQQKFDTFFNIFLDQFNEFSKIDSADDRQLFVKKCVGQLVEKGYDEHYIKDMLEICDTHIQFRELNEALLEDIKAKFNVELDRLLKN